MATKIQQVADTSFWAVPVRTGVEPDSAVRWVYVREFVDDAETIGRALQLVDLPPYCTDAYVRALVDALVVRAEAHTAVEHVTVTQRSAVAVLADENAAESLCADAAKHTHGDGALTLPAAALESVEQAAGMTAWLAQAQAVREVAAHPEVLRAEADQTVKEFVAQKRAAKQAKKSATLLPEKGGWLVVGDKHSTSQKKAKKAQASATRKNETRKAAAKKGLYNHGKKRPREDAAVKALRRRFEEDKKRVEKLKGDRKFKPI